MKFEQLNFEKNDFGTNVSLDIDLARHGEKDSFNSARIKNVDETVAIAKTQDLTDYDIVAVRTTPIERAVHTAQAIQDGFLSNESLVSDTVNVRVRELPTGVHSVEGTNIERIMSETDMSKDLNLISPRIREQYKLAVEGKEGSSWDKENAGVQLFIDLMESNLESLSHVIKDLSDSKEFTNEARIEIENLKKLQKDEGGMSMLEVVLRMSKHLQNYIEVTNRLRTNTKGYIYEVNHSGFIEPLLVYLLKKQIKENPVNSEGKTDLEKIGGGFKPNETVRISIKRQEKDSAPIIRFELRGKTYELETENDSILLRSEQLLGAIKMYE